MKFMKNIKAKVKLRIQKMIFKSVGEKMLSYFPKFYNDELLYSAISRYHMVSGNQNYKTTLLEIFDSDKKIPILEFAANLSALINKLPVDFQIESKNIIYNHTMLPLYSPFLPEERKESIIKTILYNDGRGVKTKIGIVAGDVCPKADLMYCPLCSREEYEKYGESYFHRLHQVQGVFICSIHKCLLKKYPIKRITQSRIRYIKMDNKILDQMVEYDIPNIDKHIRIAEYAEYILNNDLDSFNQEKVHKKYIELLQKKGLVNVNGRIKQKKVFEEFKSFFNEDLLNTLQSNIDYNNEYNWLKVLLRKPRRVVHPLRQILFIMFICESIEQFFIDDIYTDNVQRYPCLNHFCNNYNKLTIDDYVVTADYKTREPIITVKCTCGFIYSRKMFKENSTFGRVKEYGVLWEKHLQDLLMEKKHSVRSLSRIMKCDPKTIVKYADKLGLKKLIKTNMNISYKKDISLKSTKINFEEYKKNIIDYIRKNNNAGRKEIKAQLYKQYMWLYKNDRCWLNENLPPKKKRAHPSENNRVDWNKRDEEILISLKEQYRDLMMIDNRPRITTSILAKRIGKLAMLEKNIEQLFRSKEYINKIKETVENHQIYRVNNAVKNMCLEGEELKKWKIIRKAGLRPGFTERVSKEIDINIKNNIHLDN